MFENKEQNSESLEPIPKGEEVVDSNFKSNMLHAVKSQGDHHVLKYLMVAAHDRDIHLIMSMYVRLDTIFNSLDSRH